MVSTNLLTQVIFRYWIGKLHCVFCHTKDASQNQINFPFSNPLYIVLHISQDIVK
jgi:hypothetical protein